MGKWVEFIGNSQQRTFYGDDTAPYPVLGVYIIVYSTRFLNYI